MLKTVAITSGSGGGNGTVTNVATGTGLTGGPITSTGTIALANTTVVAGTYGNSSAVSQVIINAQGQVTNASNVGIIIPVANVTGAVANTVNVLAGTGLSGGGALTSNVTVNLANTTVTAGTYGNASTVAQVTINAQGQATNVLNVAISIANSAVTGLGTMATQNANAVVVTGGSIDGTTVGSTTAAAGSFTTLNSSGATRLGGLSGNQSLQVNNVASAVNYAQIVGSTAAGSPLYGEGPFLSAQGTDTNINFKIAGKGNGAVQLQSSGATVLNVSSSGTGVGDFINIYPTTNVMNWALAGTDTNISYALNTKGTGAFYFVTGGGQQADITNTAASVNYLGITGAATGAAPTISAQGSDANINLKLTPQGTGIVQTAATLKYAGVISGLTTKTSAYTLTTLDYTVLGNATTASFSLTLPTSVGATGQVYIIKKVDSTANTVTILTTSSQTIDGSSSKVLSYQYDGFQLQSDGANWMIIGNIFGRNGTVGTF